MKLEEKTSSRNIKGTAKCIEIYGFGIVEYYVRSESGRMIALRAQAYYLLGLPNYLCIIYPRRVRTSEGYKGNFISHCHDEHDSYTGINLKEENPGW